MAADTLNKQYNTDVFVGKSDTLVYGDEYVHSAEKMATLNQRPYDTGAKGRVFWARSKSPI